MASTSKFRSALNGFHREDVVNYLEYLNNAHASQVGQLNTELKQLRSQLNTLRNQPKEDNSALLQELEEAKAGRAAAECSLAENSVKLASLEQSLRDQKSRCAELEQEAEALREQLAQLREENTRPREEELEAYRRAERAERMAAARVAQLYAQANSVLADAALRVDETANQIGDMTDQLAAQLSQLQSCVLTGKETLKDTAASLYAIHPTEE